MLFSYITPLSFSDLFWVGHVVGEIECLWEMQLCFFVKYCLISWRFPRGRKLFGNFSWNCVWRTISNTILSSHQKCSIHHFFCRIKVVYIKLLQLSLPLLWNMTILNWSVHEFWPALVNLNKIDHPEQAFVKPFSSSVEPCYESAMCCWSHLGGGLFQSATWESNLNSGK